MQSRTFYAMGCEITAFLDREDPGAEAVLDRVPGWFERWEQRFSRFLPESELSRVNQQAGERTVVSPVFWEVLQLAMTAFNTSGGLVRPTLLPALLAAGYRQSFEQMEKDLEARFDTNPPISDPNEIEFDPATGSIWLPKGMQLDFGGIAKGWAAQQAMQRLSQYGPALVDAGGDIAVGRLTSEGLPWQIGIADPFHDGHNLETFGIAEMGAATSGSTHRHWLQGGMLQHHIIDPRTGLPAVSDIVAATVFAPTTVMAEARAKTLLILGSQAGMAWIEAQPELYGAAVLDTQEIIFDSKLEEIRSLHVSKQQY